MFASTIPRISLHKILAIAWVCLCLFVLAACNPFDTIQTPVPPSVDWKGQLATAQDAALKIDAASVLSFVHAEPAGGRNAAGKYDRLKIEFGFVRAIGSGSTSSNAADEIVVRFQDGQNNTTMAVDPKYDELSPAPTTAERNKIRQQVAAITIGPADVVRMTQDTARLLLQPYGPESIPTMGLFIGQGVPGVPSEHSVWSIVYSSQSAHQVPFVIDAETGKILFQADHATP